MTDLLRRFRGVGIALVVLAISASRRLRQPPRRRTASRRHAARRRGARPRAAEAPRAAERRRAAEDAGGREAAEPRRPRTREAADSTDADATDTHGALVSAAAQMPTPAGFRNHGAFVSCVAHMDATLATIDWTTVTPEACKPRQASAARDRQEGRQRRGEGAMPGRHAARPPGPPREVGQARRGRATDHRPLIAAEPSDTKKPAPRAPASLLLVGGGALAVRVPGPDHGDRVLQPELGDRQVLRQVRPVHGPDGGQDLRVADDVEQVLDGLVELLLGGDEAVVADRLGLAAVWVPVGRLVLDRTRPAVSARGVCRVVLVVGRGAAGRPSILSRSLTSDSSLRATWSASLRRFFGSATFISS